jgi:hypothetical protein
MTTPRTTRQAVTQLLGKWSNGDEEALGTLFPLVHPELHRLAMTVIKSVHEYEVRPRKDHPGVDLISDVLPFGRLWYYTPDNAIGYAKHSSRSHAAVIRVYDQAGNVIETHEHSGEFKEW